MSYSVRSNIRDPYVVTGRDYGKEKFALMIIILSITSLKFKTDEEILIFKND